MDLPAAAPDAGAFLSLLRKDRPAAEKAVGALSVEQQVALVAGAPVGRRRELLDLLPAPEDVVPRLPEAELCFTVKALGLESASWLLELASPEQKVAALDLDVWTRHAPDVARLDEWLTALADTSEEALHETLAEIDAELLVHWLQSRIGVAQKPDDDEGWSPPDGSRTIEGQFHFVALRDNDDVAAVHRTLALLFHRDYWTYFRLMQGVIHELPTENQEWALRWRNSRLQDLGFPPWEEAMALYRYLPPQERARLDVDESPLDVAAWQLPVWLADLPASPDAQHAVFRAIAQLSADERRAAFYAFVAVANQVAVADDMELSDSETTPRAIEKAAVWTSRGIEFLATEHAIAPDEVLRRASMTRLFRLGANLAPESARPGSGDTET